MFVNVFVKIKNQSPDNECNKLSRYSRESTEAMWKDVWALLPAGFNFLEYGQPSLGDLEASQPREGIHTKSVIKCDVPSFGVPMTCGVGANNAKGSQTSVANMNSFSFTQSISIQVSRLCSLRYSSYSSQALGNRSKSIKTLIFPVIWAEVIMTQMQALMRSILFNTHSWSIQSILLQSHAMEQKRYQPEELMMWLMWRLTGPLHYIIMTTSSTIIEKQHQDLTSSWRYSEPQKGPASEMHCCACRWIWELRLSQHSSVPLQASLWAPQKHIQRLRPQQILP